MNNSIRNYKIWYRFWAALGVIVLSFITFSFSVATLQVASMFSLLAIASAGLMWLFIRSIVNPIIDLSTSIKQIVNDNDIISIRLDERGSDEISTLASNINNMLTKVHTLINDISQQSSDVEAATEMMEEISSQTHESSEQQQSVIETMATAIDQFSLSIQDVSKNTSSAANLAGEAKQEADKGKKIVLEAISGIEKLAQQVDETGVAIHNLENDSQSIGLVLDVIKSIAEQTNLLALNAAIEAARAGEQGRGFAVVADEVRTLASRTQESTEEIQNMIERLQNGARSAVNAMSGGGALAQESVERANRAGTSLERISNNVSTISNMSHQNAVAIEEQSNVAGHTADHVAGLKQMVNEMASQAMMGSAAATELKSMMRQMDESVGKFKV